MKSTEILATTYEQIRQHSRDIARVGASAIAFFAGGDNIAQAQDNPFASASQAPVVRTSGITESRVVQNPLGTSTVSITSMKPVRAFLETWVPDPNAEPIKNTRPDGTVEYLQPHKEVRTFESGLSLDHGGIRQKYHSADYSYMSDKDKKQQIDSATNSCSELILKTSIGRQAVNYRVGGKNLSVTSDIYDIEQSFDNGANRGAVEWLGDCEELNIATYTFQPIVKRGKKVKLVGKPVTLTNNDGTLTDGFVREYSRKKVNMPLPKKITKKDKKKHLVGYRTTIKSETADPYPGQTILATDRTKTKKIDTYIGQKKKPKKSSKKKR